MGVISLLEWDWSVAAGFNGVPSVAPYHHDLEFHGGFRILVDWVAKSTPFVKSAGARIRHHPVSGYEQRHGCGPLCLGFDTGGWVFCGPVRATSDNVAAYGPLFCFWR